jgi:tRNA (adenine57-N1/adenine58-N1)-methyltransferase
VTRPHRGPYQWGDRVQLTDEKGRHHTVSLVEGGELHSHRGVLAHELLIGLTDGSVVTNSHGTEYLAFRPLLSDFAMSMPRGAAIVYPKDAAHIVTFGDIFPGSVVVEAGVGSGALTLSLLQAVGESGSVTSFERRDEFAQIAAANIEGYFGANPANHRIVVGDLVELLPTAFAAGEVDRVVLDMLAPWECVDAVADALTPGGVVVCYVATVTQMSRTVEAIRHHGGFTRTDASETIVRGWHVEGLAVRPDHRMVAHTGFLITSRRLSPGVIPPKPQRKTKPDFDNVDIETWTPGAVGDREQSAKRIRRVQRDAEALADNARRLGE